MQKLTHTIKLGKEREIQIVPFGDIHLGSRGCRLDKFKHLVDWAYKKDNVYLIGMGDLIDSIVPNDKRYVADEDIPYTSIDRLISQMREVLLPIKNKIICLLIGNHEFHLVQDGYGDPIKRLCKDLDCKYGGFQSYIKLRCEPHTHQKSLIIWCYHGWFAGRKRGAKVNNLEDNLAYYDADIYLAGHSHDLWATRKSRIHWGGSRDVIFGNTGSYLETAKIGSISYSERANYPPQKLGCLKITWRPYDEKIYVSE